MDERLKSLIERARQEAPERATRPAKGFVGELVVADSDSGDLRRSFLITKVDSRTRTLEVLLVTNEVDMATDLDLIITGESSQVGYDLLAEGELYGVLFPEQLRIHLGAIGEDLAKAAAFAVRTDGDSLPGPMAGPPLAHPDDPRRAFKEAELTELIAFTSACRRFLIDGVGDFASLDPQILLPPPVGTDPLEAQDRLFEVLDVIDELEKSGSPSLANIFDFLSTEQLQEISRWRTEFGFDLLRRINKLSHGDELIPKDSETRNDPRSLLVRSMAANNVRSTELWTLSSNSWEGLLVEESEDRMCRATPRLVGATA